MRNLGYFLLFRRSFSAAAKTVAQESTAEKSYQRMSGWQIHSYGDVEEVQFSKNLKKPLVKSPTELLVKIEASSVNPLDVAMISGYGASLFNALRCNKGNIEFPLTLGRDFVGTVVQKGLSNKSEFKIGDKIWGVVPVHHQGCHSEYITVDESFVSKKPENVSDVQAAGILYAGLTAYSGIFVSGQFGGFSGTFPTAPSNCGVGKKVLVLGGTGGVGHLAIQILQAEGAEVLTTCGPNAIPLMEKFNVSKIINYAAEDSDKTLISESPYDIILDCASKGSEYANALPWKFTNYVTFTTPLLNNFDKKGLLWGGLSAVKALVSQNVTALFNKGIIKWGYIIPSKKGILYIKKLVEDGKLVPIIDSKFSYNELPKAYEKVASGHLRGKVVVEY